MGDIQLVKKVPFWKGAIILDSIPLVDLDVIATAIEFFYRKQFAAESAVKDEVDVVEVHRYMP